MTDNFENFKLNFQNFEMKQIYLIKKLRHPSGSMEALSCQVYATPRREQGSPCQATSPIGTLNSPAQQPSTAHGCHTML
jgi:hypothetical protein